MLCPRSARRCQPSKKWLTESDTRLAGTRAAYVVAGVDAPRVSGQLCCVSNDVRSRGLEPYSRGSLIGPTSDIAEQTRQNIIHVSKATSRMPAKPAAFMQQPSATLTLRVAWHFGICDHLCEIAISDIHPRQVIIASNMRISVSPLRIVPMLRYPQKPSDRRNRSRRQNTLVRGYFRQWGPRGSTPVDSSCVAAY